MFSTPLCAALRHVTRVQLNLLGYLTATVKFVVVLQLQLQLRQSHRTHARGTSPHRLPTLCYK